MFEAISVTSQNDNDSLNPLDIGMLVEAMLFYGKVTVIANVWVLKQLIRIFGVHRLLILIEEDLLSIIYTESQLGIQTSSIPGEEFHRAISFTSPQHTYEIELRNACVEATGKTGKGRRLALKIQDRIRSTIHDEIILAGARESILNENYATTAAQIVLRNLVPELGDTSGVVFIAEEASNDVFVTRTNIDFSAVNAIYHRRISPEHSKITRASILTKILTMEADLFFASSCLSELACGNISAQLASKKIDYVMARSQKSKEKLNNFTHFIFDSAKSIREVVNSNGVDLDALVEVLLNSRRFKEWLVGKEPDANLVKDYFDEVTKTSFVDKLPGKSIRWSIFTSLGLAVDALGAGGLATGAALSLSAFDAFLIDKLIAGWKPNQFIDQVKSLIDNSHR